MLDFLTLKIVNKEKRKILRPIFNVREKTEDLMIRGHEFYAIWDEFRNEWTQDERRVSSLIDQYLELYLKEKDPDGLIDGVDWMHDTDTGRWSAWRKFVKESPDTFHELNSSVIFLNQEVKKTDYVTHHLSYPLEPGTYAAWDELISRLYAPEDREKIEWLIGSVISGDSKKIQKFFVFYGGPGTGKSTILDIIRQLFDGYTVPFDAKLLASRSASFPLEIFKSNPLLGIQDDGNLSRVEDNSLLNSLVSHEVISVNEKYKTAYRMQFQTLLLVGTNNPVKITDGKSGLLRRLIDIQPTGERFEIEEYERLMNQIPYELSGIAWHCLEVYKALGKNHYNRYTPRTMIGATNDIYNFVMDNYEWFDKASEDGIPLSVLWRAYKEFAEEARVPYPLSRNPFREEMKVYFRDFRERYNGEYSVYLGFKRDIFEVEIGGKHEDSTSDCLPELPDWLQLSEQHSILDDILKDCPAQYANDAETPTCSWDKCKTKLSDLDTSKTHYVRPPENYIVIDFDLKNEKGEKDYVRNLLAASRFPPTYVERSKGGAGLHLHYLWAGDPSLLARLVDLDIEIKVFTGKASLRRRLSKCNRVAIATIASGLPLKAVKKMLTEQSIKSEQQLRATIEKGLRKEVWPNTAPSMDFIKKVLDDAYDSGLVYDVQDLRPRVQVFAMGSTNQADRCVRMINHMKWCSEKEEPSINFNTFSVSSGRPKEASPIVFFDCEVFPNLFVLCWKVQGKGKPLIKMINPKPEEVAELFQFRLVGFNNRDYDNHMIYAASMGYTNEQLFKLSQRIIVDKDRSAKFGKAYNLSYTDIYDFLSAGNKMSLKKWEIKLGIHHQELGLPWDQPVPEELWPKVADYCGNDVYATEAVWDSKDGQADWLARQILAEWSGLSENDTTNSHTIRLIVGENKHPQDRFVYTDLSTIFPGYRYDPYGIDPKEYREGVKIVRGKSIYRGIDPGEGGFAWAQPGMYWNVGLLDIESMHPHSLLRLNIFGDEYTARFRDILDARLLIKHKWYDEARELLPERLHKYLVDKSEAKKLSNALKTAINSVYGLTSAGFENALRDPRNKDNIVAKYGALFMITLRDEVEARGYTVVHIKTDSIKIANADNEIIQFCMDFAKEYGYTFAHEATYRKMCIVNDAVYVAQYDGADACQERYGYVPEDCEEHGFQWTATGAQFQVPYVFKTLFSHEPIVFDDMCETKSVKSAIYLDFNEKCPEGWHDYRFIGKVGSFCPVIDGVGGGVLCRDAGDGRMAAVTGTKKPDGKSTYRWLEAEQFENLGLTEDQIDKSYYNRLVDEAVETISKYGDFERFVSDDTSEDLSWLNVSPGMDEEVPFPMNEPSAA